ncbi:MAG: CoB--CoM heterodisulfide reductase iron-sulfur subunit B family protein [Thermincolia bacterium]
MKIGYYPGCSLTSTAKAYDSSTRAVCDKMDVELVEVPDWSCCGSTPAHQTDHNLALALSARNLAQAEKACLNKVAAPCAACFSHLKTAAHEYNHDPKTAERINKIMEVEYKGTVDVHNLVDVMANVVGLNEVKNRVVKPLKGIKVACYYGCLLTRPAKVAQFDHPTNPQSLDLLMEALGADPVKWHAKADCCGASYALTRTDIVIKHGGHILVDAKEAGADVVAVACPLCQSNLDLRQEAIEKDLSRKLNLPILYFTELMGIALGVSPGKLGLGKHMVDPKPTLGAAFV